MTDVICPVCGRPGTLDICNSNICRIIHEDKKLMVVLECYILLDKPGKVNLEELLEIIRRYRGRRWIK